MSTATGARRAGSARDRPRVRIAGGSLGSAIVSTVMIVAVVATAMLPWWPIYESPAFVYAAGVAILAGAAIGFAGAAWAWPSWAVASAIAAAYLVLGVPVAVPSSAYAEVLPTAEGLVELVAAVALSWKQLVTISVPVGSYQSLLVPPFLLGLIVTATAVTIALRTARASAALLPPALLLVVGVVLGVVHDEVAFEAGVAFLVASIAWLVRVGIAERRRAVVERSGESALADVRRIIGATLVAAVALVGATAATLVLPPGPRDVVRAELRPPFEPSDYDSPLAAFRAAFAPEVADVEMLRVAGLPAGAGLRIATLDTYDGIVYSVGDSDRSGASGQFSRLPYRLDQSATPGEAVRLDVAVLAYDDVWVPGVGRLERIAFAGERASTLEDEFAYNDVTGTAAVRSGLERDDRYTADSIAWIEPVDLAGLRPGGAILPASPDPPDALLRLLDRWTRSSDEPGVRLAGVIEGFHREGYVSHGIGEDEVPSRSGHALDRIAELATAKPMVGDGEQYAVAAAMLARSIGFPTRVVVGYLPSGDDPAVDGEVVFRSPDLQAWIEVQAEDGAWVAVDPNPEVRPIPERQPDEPTVVSRPQSALPPPEDPTPVEDRAAEPDSGSDDPDRGAGWLDTVLAVLRVAGIVLAALALLASPFLAVIAAKARRRRLRRQARTLEGRIEGGWEEFADQATDYGYPMAQTATRAEQAAVVGGLGPAVLASVVDRAVFGPDGPGDGDDERVWAAVAELQRRMDEPLSWLERARARVSLGSLGGYAGSRKGAGT
ncbi:transglutaminase-like domain-containing protein [Agromyces binzhouensis]|uniref:Transglutaminase domain-containing protein n=1 Tax=Agromyces binzhouensis TaxID=1817495 RepID=A0A4V1QRK7_9MICO|nr:transglutaminase-like domain-containing protein [Agromyces binzhouensis]RXZ45233.1 transglutaminase domain-containing protein [Agromyces binzhouensis]